MVLEHKIDGPVAILHGGAHPDVADLDASCRVTCAQQENPRQKKNKNPFHTWSFLVCLVLPITITPTKRRCPLEQRLLLITDFCLLATDLLVDNMCPSGAGTYH